LIIVPEQGVLGNNRMLATIGKNGELRYLFWPTIDYPQHILGSLPGLFYSRGGDKMFSWMTDIDWERKRQYVTDSNIINTSFIGRRSGLRAELSDLISPDADVLRRHFSFQNVGNDDVFIRFFYYNDLAISESNIDDAAYYLLSQDAIIHYKRNCFFIYGGTRKSSGHQCGVHGESSDAFSDVYDSQLSGGSLTLYDGSRDVNSCLSWDLGMIKPQQTVVMDVIISLGTTEKTALGALEKARNTDHQTQLKAVQEFWENWLSGNKRVLADTHRNALFRRSLLILKLLTDKTHGGIIAAPCMEPEYRFCWPRDATYSAYALDVCGFHAEAARFYEWCARAQEPEGGLYQRYYIEAKLRGPCWSSQIDEIATVVWGIGRHYELTRDISFVRSLWPLTKRAASFLLTEMDENSSLVSSVGLWEEEFGSHTYSNSAVYNALKTSARIATLMQQNALSKQWNAAAEKVKSGLLSLAWDKGKERFMKRCNPRDDNLDASLLGIAYPFEVLPFDDERIRKTVSALEHSFNFETGGIGRYPGDEYYGGNAWVLTTMWLALYYKKLGNIQKTDLLIDWVVNHSTDLNMLSEQVDKSNGKPISAVPLAWSHAFFVVALAE
jgi:glucoamylase